MPQSWDGELCIAKGSQGGGGHRPKPNPTSTYLSYVWLSLLWKSRLIIQLCCNTCHQVILVCLSVIRYLFTILLVTVCALSYCIWPKAHKGFWCYIFWSWFWLSRINRHASHIHVCSGYCFCDSNLYKHFFSFFFWCQVTDYLQFGGSTIKSFTSKVHKQKLSINLPTCIAR